MYVKLTRVGNTVYYEEIQTLDTNKSGLIGVTTLGILMTMQVMLSEMSSQDRLLLTIDEDNFLWCKIWRPGDSYMDAIEAELVMNKKMKFVKKSEKKNENTEKRLFDVTQKQMIGKQFTHPFLNQADKDVILGLLNSTQAGLTWNELKVKIFMNNQIMELALNNLIDLNLVKPVVIKDEVHYSLTSLGFELLNT